MTRIIKSRGGRAAVVGLFVLAGAVGACYLYFHNPYTTYPLPCAFYLITGYYCPGCGAGRAAYYLLHGRFYEAFAHNCVMVILLPFFVMYWCVWAFQWVKDGKVSFQRKIPSKPLQIILYLVIIYGILRNIPVSPFSLLAPGGML